MRPDPEALSAYLDGEVSPPFEESIALAIANDRVTAERFERLKRLRASLPTVSDAQVAESAARSWLAVQNAVGNRRTNRRRMLEIPLPIVAAAAAAVVVLAGALLWALFAQGPVPGEQLLAGHQNVDVTIQVSDGDMEEVLSWLAAQDMLGEVSIQLPEQQFSIVGEPVLVKYASYGGEPNQ